MEKTAFKNKAFAVQKYYLRSNTEGAHVGPLCFSLSFVSYGGSRAIGGCRVHPGLTWLQVYTIQTLCSLLRRLAVRQLTAIAHLVCNDALKDTRLHKSSRSGHDDLHI